MFKTDYMRLAVSLMAVSNTLGNLGAGRIWLPPSVNGFSVGRIQLQPEFDHKCIWMTADTFQKELSPNSMTDLI